MRSSWGLALPFLCPLAAAASSGETRVFLFPGSSKGHNHGEQKLDAETARLIFARRMGLSHLYDLGDSTEQQLEQISELGGGSSQLLGLQQPSTPQHKGILVVETDATEGGAIPHIIPNNYDELTIASSPSTADTIELLDHFEEQLRQLDAKDDTITTAACDNTMHAFLQSHELVQTCRPWSVSSLNAPNIGKLDSILNFLATTEQQQFTVIVTPPKSERTSKRSANAYGAIQSRQNRQEPEMVLSEATVTYSAPPSSFTALKDDKPKKNTTSALRGILPSCFASREDCEDVTRSCTGHGECTQKYKIKEPNSDKVSVCWACSCKAQVEKSGAGTKTTRYGGPACQKKDIVMPFWLFTGFTIAFLSVLTWAIALLYNMGNEDLPSVIGAGVSGPVKK